MEQADLGRAREKFEQEVRKRFAGAAIDKVELLQYGDDPEIEPGEVMGRVVLAFPEGADPSDKEVRKDVIDSFERAHQEAIEGLRKAMREGPGPATLEIFVAGADADPKHRGPMMKMKIGGRHGPLALAGDQTLTPVMARVGPEDLETLDTLIAVGIAGSRAEAVRWALARIRERPAYEQIRARSREIEDLKSQF
jgi:hypothetical protein